MGHPANKGGKGIERSVLNILQVLMLSPHMLDKSEAQHLKELLACAAIVVRMALPAPTLSCSAVGCLDRGVEFRRSFTVTVTHQRKPLRRVSVQVTGNSEGGDRRAFSEPTRSNGAAHFANLPPGEPGGGSCSGVSLEIEDPKTIRLHLLNS